MPRLLALLLLLAAAPALADTPAPAGPRVVLETGAGPITIELDTARAPITAANFLRYVDERRFDGTSFYRALSFPGRPDLGLVQGGIRSDPKRARPPIPHEPTSATGLAHGDFTVSMARTTPGTAQGDFFITLGSFPSLDAQPGQPGDNSGFAVFGRVVDGQDTVRAILAAPVSPTAGEGAMKGQMIAEPVPILRARRAD
jgi:peptidyl-prolyl cis-trans isomerase A (cyclophilin A)